MILSVLRRLRPFAVGVIVSAGVLAPIVAATTVAELDRYLLRAAAITGLLVTAVVEVFRALRPRLGTFTAAAGTCAASGAVLLGITSLTPSCPGTTTRCSASEIGAWTLSGVLLAVTAFLVVGAIPAARTARRTIVGTASWGYRTARRRATATGASPARRAGGDRDAARRRRRAQRRQQARSRRKNR